MMIISLLFFAYFEIFRRFSDRVKLFFSWNSRFSDRVKIFTVITTICRLRKVYLPFKIFALCRRLFFNFRLTIELSRSRGSGWLPLKITPDFQIRQLHTHHTFRWIFDQPFTYTTPAFTYYVYVKYERLRFFEHKNRVCS